MTVSVKGGKALIGDDVVIQPGAVVDAATIEEGAMIGMGAHVHHDVFVGRDAYVDAGCVVPPGSTVAAGSVWTGNPGRELRKLTEDEMSLMRTNATTYAALSQEHRGQAAMGVAELEQQEHERLYRIINHMEETAPLPREEEDIAEYYRLAQPAPHTGLFREKEFNDDELSTQREAEEAAADDAEDAHYANLASLNRVASAVRELTELRAERADIAQELVARLQETDPKAAHYLVDLLARTALAPAASAAGGTADADAARSQLTAELLVLDPFRDPEFWEAEDQLGMLQRHARSIPQVAAAVETRRKEIAAGASADARA